MNTVIVLLDDYTIDCCITFIIKTLKNSFFLIFKENIISAKINVNMYSIFLMKIRYVISTFYHVA